MKEPNLPIFKPDSHKGEYGKVMIVGGSPNYYGAPILTALGCENAGADLIWLYLPKENINIAKNYSLNFFIKPFIENELSMRDVDQILADSKNIHTIAIGNGLSTSKETKEAIIYLLENFDKPVVIDAGALFPEILEITSNDTDFIVTPHKGEFERLFGTTFSSDNLKDAAKKYNLTILVKGQIDYIAQKNILIENHTGCPQMRVGGTGDVLAGIVAAYRAMGLSNLEASYAAIHHYGKAGEKLAKQKRNFTAYDLAKNYPALIL